MLALLAAVAAAAQATGSNIKVNEYTYAFPYPSEATRADWEYVPGASWAVDPSDAVDPVPVVLDNPPFFARYVEGSSFNKALVIFNPSSEPVSLAPFSIRVIWSGGASGNNGQTVTFPDTAVIEPQSTFVVIESRAPATELQDAADLRAGLSFNGNDAVILYKGDDMIDTIGNLAGNPGDGWTVAGVPRATKDHTLVRKASVLIGTRSWTDAAETEWDVLDGNTFENLDTHTIDIPQTTPTGPNVLRMVGEVSRLRLEAEFTLPTAGMYEIWGRVQLAEDAVVSDLLLTLFGLSSTGAETFYSRDLQISSVPRGVWYEFQIGHVNATTSSLAHYVLSPRSMFNETSYAGYMVDYVRVHLVMPLDPPSLTIVSPFATQDIPSPTVPVEFAVSSFDFPANGYVFYEIDGAPPPLSDIRLESTAFTLYQLAPGNHALKLFLFDAVANRVVATATRFFSVRLPPPSVSRVLAIAEDFTSIGIRWESDVANSIDSYEVEYRAQNDDRSFGDWTELYSGAGTDAIATGLLPATTYHFAVRAINAIGVSEWAAASFRTRGAVRINGEHASEFRRDQLIRALRGLNQKGIYQRFTHIHMRAFGFSLDGRANIAHRGPTFIHWHRQFLLDLEHALQREVNDPTLGLMFWCWFCHDDLDDDRADSIFSEDFLGGDGQGAVDWRGGLVRDGPFRTCGSAEDDPGCTQFVIIQDFEREIVPAEGGIRRAFDATMNRRFPTRQMVADFAAGATGFDNYPFSGGVRPQIESWHNFGHVFIGGSMLSGTSPNDVAFYFNHATTDLLHVIVKREHPDLTYETPGSRYPDGAGPDDFMWPWDGSEYDRFVSPRMMEDHLALGYRYAETWDPAWEEVAPVGTIETLPIVNPAFAAGLDGWTAVNTTIAPDTGRAVVDAVIFQATTDVLEPHRQYTVTLVMDASPSAFEVAITAGSDLESAVILSEYEGTLPSTSISVDYTVRSSHRLLGERVGVLVRSLDADVVSVKNLTLVAEVIPEDAGLSSSLIAAPINVEVIVAVPAPSAGAGDGDDDSVVDGPEAGDGDDDDDDTSSGGGSGGDSTAMIAGLVAGVVGVVGGAMGGFLAAKRRPLPRPDDYHAQL